MDNENIINNHLFFQTSYLSSTSLALAYSEYMRNLIRFDRIIGSFLLFGLLDNKTLRGTVLVLKFATKLKNFSK